MLRDGYERRDTTFLRINADGKLYVSSKEPKEGYVEHKSKTGTISYWKEYSAVQGKLRGAMIKEVEYDGAKAKFLMLFMRDGEEDYAIVTPLFTQKGGLNSYVKSFVRYFENIDLTKDIIIAPQARKKDEKYAPGGFWINYVGDDGKNGPLVPMFYKRDTNGWPDLDSVTTITGEKKWDSSRQDKFAYDKLVSYIELLSNRKEKPKEEPKTDTRAPERDKTETVSPEPTGNEFPETDDLPF